MSSRWWSRLAATLGSVGLVGSLLLAGASSVSAANTRTVYFGSPDGGFTTGSTTSISTCGQVVPTDFWANIYPYGTGGCYNASGSPVAGQNSYSPVTTGGSAATDIVISNSSAGTLTQIQLNGGVTAPGSPSPANPINTASVPLMPSPPPAGSDSPICSALTDVCIPSLPTGLYYQAVYVIANPYGVSVPSTSTSCLSNTGTAPSGYYDSLACPIGNLAFGQSVTLRVVVADVSAPPSPYETWFELGVKEGASSTGSNSDTFFTYSDLSVGSPQCSGVSNFFLGGQGVSLSNSSNCQLQLQTTNISTAAVDGSNQPIFPNGVPASVGTSNSTVNSLGDCPLGPTGCFGYESTASVALGNTITGGLQWIVFWSAGLVPSGGPKGAFHTHMTSTGSVTDQLYFKKQDQCGSPNANPNFCWAKLSKDKSGNYTATLESPTNGKVYGF